MTSWSLRMTVTGLSLILAGFLFGLAFGWSVDHEARLAAHDAYRPVFEAIAGSGHGDDAWPLLEQEISERSVAHRRAADTHGHSVNMGILLILVGLLAPLFADQSRNNGRLLLLASSTVLYPIGLSLQFLTLTLLGEVLSAAGAIGALAALVALLMRLWNAVNRLETGER